MNKFLHKACIYSGGILVTLFTVGVILGHLFPWTFRPTDSAQYVGQYYATHHTEMLIGFTFGIFASCFVIPFTAAVAWETQRMVGGWRTIAANIQLGFGIMFAMIGFFPWVVFMAAAFRPDQNPEIVRALNDLGFNLFEAPQGVAVIHLTFLGIAMLLDKRAIRTFPRWVAYLSFATAAVDLLGSFVQFQLSGPWAWNGVIAAWIVSAFWGMWLNAMMYFMAKSADREWAVPEAELYDIVLPGTPGATDEAASVRS